MKSWQKKSSPLFLSVFPPLFSFLLHFILSVSAQKFVQIQDRVGGHDPRRERGLAE
jgi:hypothetical protein